MCMHPGAAATLLHFMCSCKARCAGGARALPHLLNGDGRPCAAQLGTASRLKVLEQQGLLAVSVTQSCTGHH